MVFGGVGTAVHMVMDTSLIVTGRPNPRTESCGEFGMSCSSDRRDRESLREEESG